jgi:hypothetical protein
MVLHDHLTVCVYVCVSPPNNFRMLEPVFMKHGTAAHLDGVLRKSLPSVVPELQPLMLLG